MRPIYFYVPSLIGYLRIVCFVSGIYLIATEAAKYNAEPILRETYDINEITRSRWFIGLVLYTLNFVLDFFDGFAGRQLDQVTEYSVLLDVVTDRCATTSLLLVLASYLYRDYLLAFNFLMVLDVASHWYHMHAYKQENHKEIGKDKNIIMRTFYNVYPLFGYVNIGTEFYYVFLAAARFLPIEFPIYPGSSLTVFGFAQYFLLPSCVLKVVANVAQLASGAAAIAKEDLMIKRQEQAAKKIVPMDIDTSKPIRKDVKSKN